MDAPRRHFDMANNVQVLMLNCLYENLNYLSNNRKHLSRLYISLKRKRFALGIRNKTHHYIHCNI